MNSSPSARKSRSAFASALLLARHEDHAVVDRQSLRREGIRTIRLLTSGVEAARILAGMQRLTDNLPFPDLVLCDEQLSDMTGQEFLMLVRSHPRLASFPVVMSLMRDTPAIRRAFEELAGSGLLFRPYSGDAFLNQLARAASMHPPQADASAWEADAAEIGAFERALARFSLSRKVSDQSAGQWFREGLLCLKQEQWEGAAVAFRQALKEQADHGDAIRGLTLALCKRQEEADVNPQARKRRLSREEADALRDNLVLAAAADNPEEAIRQAMIEALGGDIAPLAPLEPPAPLASGRAESPVVTWGEPARKKQAAAEESDPLPPAEENAAAPLKPLPELREPDSAGVLSRFPLLRDAVNVARVTLGLYKQGKK